MREQAYSIFRKVDHTLSRIGSYLYVLCGDDLREKIDRTRRFAGQPKVKAIVTASAVFMALYLAVGFGAAGLNWREVLIWPYRFLVVAWSTRVAAFILAAFAGVALYVYRLKLRLLLQTPAGKEYEAQAAAAKEAARVATEARKRAESRAAAAERKAQAANEALKRAEKRAADAEANVRAAAQNTGGEGRDEKFTEARRAFARLYHPDNVKAGGLDKIIRAEIFKEYWQELERIQKSGKK